MKKMDPSTCGEGRRRIGSQAPQPTTKGATPPSGGQAQCHPDKPRLFINRHNTHSGWTPPPASSHACLHGHQEGQKGELHRQVVGAAGLGHARRVLRRLVHRGRQLQAGQALRQRAQAGGVGEEGARSLSGAMAGLSGAMAAARPCRQQHKSLSHGASTHLDGLVDVHPRREVEPLVKGGQRLRQRGEHLAAVGQHCKRGREGCGKGPGKL